jgi:hypothetical protein
VPTNVAVIELGDDFAPVETPSRPRTVPPSRWWLFALALALVLALGGAGGPGAGQFVELARVPAVVADSFQLFDDSLYVWDNRQPRTQTEITRYGLDGSVRWQRLVAGNGPETFVLETAHETIVDANLVDGDSHLMGLDRATGAVLWDQTATFGNGYPYVQMVDPQGRLLVYETGSRGARLSWIDSRTGAAVWRIDLPKGWNPDFGSDPAPGGKVWLVSLGGDVMRVNLDDRGLTATRHVTGLAGVDGLDYRTITAGHDLIIVTDVSGVFPQEQYATLHAYDERTLTHRWDDAPGTNASASFCGDQICETSNVGLRVVDPRSGRPLWNTASEAIFASGPNLLVGPYSPSGLGRQIIVAGNTGRKLADVTAWSFTPAKGALLLTQPTRGYVGVWLGWLAPGDLRPRILGAIPDMSTRCTATARDIACRAIDGTIVLWRAN